MSGLKRIAEAMGYESWQYENKIYCRKLDPEIEYRFMPHGDIFAPEENPAQLLEVLKWLLKQEWSLLYHEESLYYILDHATRQNYSESLSEAIMQAAREQVR